jgi:hypothetical protein
VCSLIFEYGSVWGGWCSNEVHGVGLWKNIIKGWRGFFVILYLRLMMALGLDSSMTCRVGIMPSRQLFQTCSVWPVLRILQWLIFWSFLVTLINTILAFLEQLMIFFFLISNVVYNRKRNAPLSTQEKCKAPRGVHRNPNRKPKKKHPDKHPNP